MCKFYFFYELSIKCSDKFLLSKRCIIGLIDYEFIHTIFFENMPLHSFQYYFIVSAPFGDILFTALFVLLFVPYFHDNSLPFFAHNFLLDSPQPPYSRPFIAIFSWNSTLFSLYILWSLSLSFPLLTSWHSEIETYFRNAYTSPSLVSDFAGWGKEKNQNKCITRILIYAEYIHNALQT